MGLCPLLRAQRFGGEAALARPIRDDEQHAACEVEDAEGLQTCLPFLPPYSPDLNSIEMILAKLETLSRNPDRRMEEARRKVGTLLDLFPPEECAADISHAGYGSEIV